MKVQFLEKRFSYNRIKDAATTQEQKTFGAKFVDNRFEEKKTIIDSTTKDLWRIYEC